MIKLFILLCLISTIIGQDIPIIQKRLVQSLLDGFMPSSINQVKEWMSSQESSGKWSDIHYTQGLDAPRAAWTNNDHLERCLKFSQAYYNPSSSLYKNAGLLSSSNKCINYWFDNDYNNEGCTHYNANRCPSNTPGFWNGNWWWNMVGIPTSFSGLCILMENDLSSSQKVHCTKILNRANYTGWTAANILFMAIVQVSNGVFNNDATRIGDALKVSYEQLQVMNGPADGIKIDGTFFQHDRQLYNEGYGLDFVNALLEMLYYTQGTSFKATDSQIEALSSMLLNGNAWLIHCTNASTTCVWFISASGREITRDYIILPRIKTDYLRVAVQGWPRQKELIDFCDALEHKITGTSTYPFSGNKVFWKSDSVVHRRNGWSVNLKMFSTRTRNSECVNLENLQGVHLSDGALYVYHSGHEYDEIFDVWNWYRIPGITVDYGSGVLECDHTSFIGLTSFVGAVSDGLDAVAGFDFLDPQTKEYSYKKSWFFFDNAVVVLITDITCKKSCNTNHVFDSRLLVPPVSGPVSFPSNGTIKITGLPWLHHDSIGYYFKNNKSDIYVDVGKGTHGDWSKIGVSTKKDVKDIFTAWSQDTSTSFAYIMVPSVDLKTFQSMISSKALDQYMIIQNSENTQAIFDSTSDRLGVVFWSAGSLSFKGGWNIASNEPATILLKQLNSNTLSLSVSDPTQTLKSITVTIDRTVSCKTCHCESPSCSCAKCTSVSPKTDIVFTLPTGEYAGSSVVQTLSF